MTVYIKAKQAFEKKFPQTALLLSPYRMLIKYLISGTLAAFTDLSLLYALTDLIGLHYLLSAILAFASAFFVSFGLQKYWTFRDVSRKVGQQMAIYLLVALFNLGLNTAGMYGLVEYFGLMYILAQVIMGALIAVFSFSLYRLLIFRKINEDLR